MTTLKIIDGHNDTFLRLYQSELEGRARSFFERSETGHLDYPRAIEGGLAGGFFAVFVPNKKRGEGKMPAPAADGTMGYQTPLPKRLKYNYAARQALAIASRIIRAAGESAGRVAIVQDVAALERCLDNGRLAIILHFEGAEAIDKHFDALHVWYAAGLRSLGLVWSRPNRYAAGVPFNYPGSPDVGPGLTDLGKALVRECNQLGVMIDLSHLNEKGFWDVAALTEAPLVATHSNAHALCPVPRNLTDKQLDAIGESGGLVGVNFHTSFLRADGRFDQPTSLSEIVRHLTYIAGRIGVDHVAFGSDFDGANMPEDLGDAAGLPRLVDALRQAGFDETDVRKITRENWLRVLRQTWRA